MFEETGTTSWKGTRVRKGDKYGTVIRDLNGFTRNLTFKMDDGTTEHLSMNNVGPDDPKNKEWEWYWDKTDDKKWYRF